MRTDHFPILLLFFGSACESNADSDPEFPSAGCVRASGYAPTGETALGTPKATVSESAPGRLAFAFQSDDGAVESTYAFPTTIAWDQPAQGGTVTLIRFYPGSSDELGLVTGEASFAPEIIVHDDVGLVAQVGSIDSFPVGEISFVERERCAEDDGTAVTDGALVVDGTEVGSDEQIDVDLDDRRYRVHVLDAFVNSGALRGHVAMFRLPL